MVTHCALQLGAPLSFGHAFRAYASECHGWRTFRCANARSNISIYTKLDGRISQKLMMSSAHETEDEILPLASRDGSVRTDDDLSTTGSDKEIEHSSTGIPWQVAKTLRAFKRRRPIEEAETPPSAWYTDTKFAEYEFERVFGRGWQAVGLSLSLSSPALYCIVLFFFYLA